MLLEHKTAIVYGAAGPVGAAVARAFARQGARVILVGRAQQTLAKVAQQVRDAGGTAQTAVVDVTSTAAMRAHADEVAAASGSIDIAFSATSSDDLQGIPLLDMDFADFARPVSKVITTHFTTATATARRMRARGCVILAMGGGREAIPLLGGSHVAWSALAGLCRQLAAELAPSGIRVAWMLSRGSPDPGECRARRWRPACRGHPSGPPPQLPGGRQRRCVRRLGLGRHHDRDGDQPHGGAVID